MPDYTVTFQADGATVKTMTVEDGYVLKDSDYPAVPTKTGYTGEWVKYTSAIHSNVTVQAKYTAVVAKYTVTFKADNTVVKTMTVKDGYTLKASDYPTVPAKSGYTGEWVKYTSAIHSNVTVQAKYTAVVTKYTVFFKADGFTVKAIQVNDGYVLQDADYPEVPAKVGCNGAWEKHTAAIHSNVTINAVYSPISSHYTVTYKAASPLKKSYSVDSTLEDLLAEPAIRAFLSNMMEVDMIPDLAYGLTLRQAAEAFAGGVSAEQAQRLNALLEEF